MRPATTKATRSAVTEHKLCQFKVILAPTDFSERANAAFRYATQLSRTLGGQVILLNVVQSPAVTVYEPFDQEKLACQAQTRLDRVCHHEHAEQDNVETMIRFTGEPVWKEIVFAARESGADLIVLPPEDRPKLSHFVFGSNIDRIVRHAPCPVLMAPPLWLTRAKYQRYELV
jgi:nucleotide-binding universal stress UspA family protein